MGTGKKEAARRERQGVAKTDGIKIKGENFYRSAKKIKTLNILKSGKAQRNAVGEITKAAVYQSRDRPTAVVQPNRKWFNATRVISQQSLEAFRGAVAQQASDPYSYLLKQNKLPMSLIRDVPNTNGLKQHQAKIAVETAPFSDTFGPKMQRKRVKLNVSSLDGLAEESAKMHDNYLDRLEEIKLLSGTLADGADSDDGFDTNGVLSTAREAIFSKGQSKRIWNELYKTIDASDVILMVLDARDPVGTRCKHVEKYLREEAPHKHIVIVLNKVDLVPARVAAAWVRTLSTEYPTLAFHASVTNSFGKGSLIQLLRQFSALHKERKQISCSLVGYPNTGKSSIINTLRAKKVCNVAPIAGETKVWQYVTLMKRIYLIDAPGIVPPNKSDTDEQLLLRGVVRVENIEHPGQYIEGLLNRCKPHHVCRTYELKSFSSPDDFLEQLARKGGRLLKGGEPDLDGVSKMVINDFLRGKIPWFTPPPDNATEQDEGVAGRQGRLGEMGKKRKREEDQEEAIPQDEKEDDDNDHDEDEFEGFGDENDGSDASGLDEGDDNDGLEKEDAVTLIAEESESADEGDSDNEIQAISNVLASARKKQKQAKTKR